MRADALPDPGVRASSPSAPTPERSRLDRYLDGLIHQWSLTLTTLGFCLIPLFFILDCVTMPRALWVRFGSYRAAVTVAVIAHHLILRRTRPNRYSYIHGYIFSLLVGGMIVEMTVDLGGFNSSYYAGLNLVIVAANLLLPWRAIHSAINGLVVLTLYVLANAVHGAPFATASLINNLYFLGSTLIIAVAINHTKHRLIEQEFTLRTKLLDANENLDRSRSELKAARDALWGEMEVAKRIQTALLPRNQRLGPYNVSALMQPAAEVGGDYYDFIETRAGEQWVAIGDVSGHGVESGLVMMMTQTSILSMVNDRPALSPSDVFAAVNGVLHKNIGRMETNRYMTLNLIKLEPRALIVSGKHQDILVYRHATRSVETISNQGCWIGVVADARAFVEDQRIDLSPGDIVLLFTDGVTEATSRSGEMFGDERLAEAFLHVAHLPLHQGLKSLLATVTAFEVAQEDDITLMLVQLPVAQS